MDERSALAVAEDFVRNHDGRTDHVQLQAEEFDSGWLIYVVPRQIGVTLGGVNLVVDKSDGSVRSVTASINPNLVMADYVRFRATTPPAGLSLALLRQYSER